MRRLSNRALKKITGRMSGKAMTGAREGGSRRKPEESWPKTCVTGENRAL